MNAEIFAEWLRRQGRKVYHTASSSWYDAGPRVLQASSFRLAQEKFDIEKLVSRLLDIYQALLSPL